MQQSRSFRIAYHPTRLFGYWQVSVYVSFIRATRALYLNAKFHYAISTTTTTLCIFTIDCNTKKIYMGYFIKYTHTFNLTPSQTFVLIKITRKYKFKQTTHIALFLITGEFAQCALGEIFFFGLNSKQKTRIKLMVVSNKKSRTNVHTMLLVLLIG